MKFFRSAISLIILGIICSLFVPCISAVELSDPSLTSITNFVFNGNSISVTDGNDTNYEIVIYHSDDTETDPVVTTNGNTSTYTIPSGDNGELSIAIKKAGGSYKFSGNGNGNITVKKGATGTSYLYLNGLTLTSSFTSVITVNKDSTVPCVIYVMGGTTNTLTDAAQNNDDVYTDNAAAESAVIKAKASSNIWLLGNGILNINGNAKNGIKANGSLTIAGNVELNISAYDNGISGENTISIYSGNINITTETGDGIKCGADDTPTGDITIYGGTITIDAYADGIQATANLTIEGGVFDILCYGGYTSQYDGDSDAYPSAKGLKASGSYTNESGTEVDATECYLTISGGYFMINSADDAIHSDKDITITAGVFDLYSTDDGIHSEYNNSLGKSSGNNTDLYITIHKCYEGIEGANIYIYSGIINVFASDDSINAANADLSNYNFSVDITGGIIYCASLTGDCLDSNKNFTISGGTLVVLGSITQQDNTAVDTDGTFAIKGGEILTIGNSGMLTNPTTTQNYCSWTTTGSATATGGGSSGGGSSSIGRPTRPGQSGSTGGAGSVVSNNKQLTITDSNGNTLISVAIQWDGSPSGSASYALYSRSDLTSGSSYTLSTSEISTVSGGSNITSASVSAQPTTPVTDESATPVIPEDILAGLYSNNDDNDDNTNTDEIAAQAVVDQISALDGTNEDAIISARNAYEALTEVQKALVTNLDA
ncbi:MAG: carbohydrate-binding domain-containing protein, partial [Clostridia bacterium]|nr:carbohydrate-binding domain-containing protein [Clostridia bacterium]